MQPRNKIVKIMKLYRNFPRNYTMQHIYINSKKIVRVSVAFNQCGPLRYCITSILLK